MTEQDRSHSQAESVTRAIVGSVYKLGERGGVPPEVVLEGLLKAVAVVALQQMGTSGAVAEVFENFAETVRQLPLENITMQ